MSSVVTPALAAAVAAAPRVECALKMLVSMPALSKTVFSHLATVDGATGLCGLMTPNNSLIELGFTQSEFLRFFSYAFSVCTGHNLFVP